MQYCILIYFKLKENKQANKQANREDTDNDNVYDVCKTIDKTHATTKPNLKWQTH